MKWVDRLLLNFEELFLALLFGIMPLICFLQVLCRYVFKFPVPWSEESMRVLFVWATFIGASLGVKRGAHLGVTALVNLLPVKAKEFTAVIINFVSAVFCLYFAYNGLIMVLMQARTGQVLPVSGIPAYLSTSALPTGFFLMVIRFILTGIEKWNEASNLKG